MLQTITMIRKKSHIATTPASSEVDERPKMGNDGFTACEPHYTQRCLRRSVRWSLDKEPFFFSGTFTGASTGAVSGAEKDLPTWLKPFLSRPLCSRGWTCVLLVECPSVYTFFGAVQPSCQLPSACFQCLVSRPPRQVRDTCHTVARHVANMLNFQI